MFLPNPLTSSESYRAVTAICPGGTVSWHQSQIWGCLGIGQQRQPARNLIGAQRYLTISHVGGATTSNMALATQQRWTVCDRDRSRLATSTHWMAVFALIFGPLFSSDDRHSRALVIAQLIPCFSTPRRQGEVTELPLHARLHRATTPSAHLTLLPAPRMLARGGPQVHCLLALRSNKPVAAVHLFVVCSVCCPARLLPLTTSTLPRSPSGGIYCSPSWNLPQGFPSLTSLYAHPS
ncbi:hypothetical protein N657DRAFT_446020 [Parathielavia appendiculata]|uniref:Uncharacterized protein n=1 Tax=Parathielavia appendiculata TaxID=2587402 RepID=A0AAN6Z3T7_9PEZI|nr:hypothetical protein N657DRAFT_446020 [Parathielavia appendiculata]